MCRRTADGAGGAPRGAGRAGVGVRVVGRTGARGRASGRARNVSGRMDVFAEILLVEPCEMRWHVKYVQMVTGTLPCGGRDGDMQQGREKHKSFRGKGNQDVTKSQQTE